MGEFDNLTKRDVWSMNSSDSRKLRWQRIMRKAYESSKRGRIFEMASIPTQRTFKCEYCQRWAEYAHYPSLAFFCEPHAEAYSAWQGVTPWWKLQPAKSG